MNMVYLGNHFGPMEEASMQWETPKVSKQKEELRDGETALPL